jgi:hypothetical protein
LIGALPLRIALCSVFADVPRGRILRSNVSEDLGDTVDQRRLILRLEVRKPLADRRLSVACCDVACYE